MNGWSLLGLLALVLAVSIVATLYQPVAEVIRSVYETISASGAVGMLVLVLIQALVIICAIPVIVSNAALCAIYSWPEALAVSMTGFSLGISVIYAMIMHFKWEPNDVFRGLYTAMKYEPYKYTFIAKFIAMPSAIKNYGLASCPISFQVYFITAFVHALYVNGLQLAIARQLWTAESLTSYIVMGVTALIGIVSLLVFSYLAQKAIRRAQQEPLLPDATTPRSSSAVEPRES